MKKNNSASCENAKRARQARIALAEKGCTLTKAKKQEATNLLQIGTPPTEICELVGLTLPQVEKLSDDMRKSANRLSVSESIQMRTTKVGMGTEAVAKYAQSSEKSVIDHLLRLIQDETDTSKVATALKVLHSIAESAEEKQELTQVISRLRGN